MRPFLSRKLKKCSNAAVSAFAQVAQTLLYSPAHRDHALPKNLTVGTTGPGRPWRIELILPTGESSGRTSGS